MKICVEWPARLEKSRDSARLQRLKERMRSKSWLRTIACAVIFSFALETLAAKREYRIINIRSRMGYGWTADRINNSGDVIGTFRSRSDHSLRGYLYSRGRIVDLGTVRPMGINDHGDVIMWRIGDDAPLSVATLLYSGGRYTNVTSLATRSNSVVAVHGRSINNQGVIVGGCRFSPGGDDHPFVYSNGVMQVFARVFGHQTTEAIDINNFGRVIGYASDGTAALYEGSRRILVGVVPNWSSSYANSINDLGYIVGGTVLQGFEGRRPFIWNDGVTTIVKALPGYPTGILNDINNPGVAVGAGENPNLGGSRAILHKDGATRDLNLLVRRSKLTFVTANSINDRGWIAVTAEREAVHSLDDSYAILLKPRRGNRRAGGKPGSEAAVAR